MTTTAKPPLRPADIDALNETRRRLEKIRNRIAFTSEHGEVRLLVKVEDALAAIFDILNVAKVYCDIAITPGQLHEWREDES